MGRPAGLVLGDGQILTFGGTDIADLIDGYILTAQESFAGFCGGTVRAKGRTPGGAADGQLGIGLAGRQSFDQCHQTAGGAECFDRCEIKPRSGQFLGQHFLDRGDCRGYKAGWDFLGTDFKQEFFCHGSITSLEHREAETLPLTDVTFSTEPGNRADATDVGGPLSDGDRATGIQQVEGM